MNKVSTTGLNFISRNVKENIDTIKFLLNLVWEYFSKKK